MGSKGFAVLLLAVVGASAHGCSGGTGLGGAAGGGAGSTGSGVAGTGESVSGGAGTSGAGTSGAGTSGAGTSGAAGTTGVAGTRALGAPGAAGVGPLSGAMIEPTPGCGQPLPQQPGAQVRYTIQTMGSKPADCADSRCGAWAYAREYYLRVPAGYDGRTPYPLTIEGPGCGGKGNNLYVNSVLDRSAIRVGLTPSADAQAFHAVNPGQNCFDDHDGDDSVDWAFYEALYDKLAGELCFDRNRVFAAGNASGARMANELGCKYAGDVSRPVRGVMTNAGGLPTDPKHAPLCSSKPVAGIWVYEIADQTYPFAEVKRAIENAMLTNGCPAGAAYEAAKLEPFQISSSDSTSCKRVMGCPAASPVVICPLPFITKGSHENIVNPGWVAFLKLFEATP